jgi:hypothetical protein
MNDNPLASELSDLMTEKPASFITITKEETEQPKERVDINAILESCWSSKSNSLLSDYKYGKSLAQFGECELNTKAFYKRLGTVLCATVSNECQKRGMSSEDLKPIYGIIENSLRIISKEIEKKDLKDFEILSIIAALQGFLINYNKKDR